MLVAPVLRVVDLASAHALFKRLSPLPTEMAVFAYLSKDADLLGLRHMHGGCVDAVDVPVRQVVADALAFDAAGVVMAHNHPSGDPRPSVADRETTRRLLLALDPIDIRLIDHLVLAPQGVTSFRAMGWL